jgi:hypothetical protein
MFPDAVTTEDVNDHNDHSGKSLNPGELVHFLYLNLL